MALEYPQRTRCATCRKKLGELVLMKKYCSYKCAAVPEPPADLMKTSRGHRRQVDGEWKAKRAYRCEEEVTDPRAKDASVEFYLCETTTGPNGGAGCYMFHTGHSRPKSKGSGEKSRIVHDMAELGSVCERMRGGRTRAQIANKAGVRPIRVKEIEAGAPKPEALFPVLTALGLRMVVDFPPGFGES